MFRQSLLDLATRSKILELRCHRVVWNGVHAVGYVVRVELGDLPGSRFCHQGHRHLIGHDLPFTVGVMLGSWLQNMNFPLLRRQRTNYHTAMFADLMSKTEEHSGKKIPLTLIGHGKNVHQSPLALRRRNQPHLSSSNRARSKRVNTGAVEGKLNWGPFPGHQPHPCPAGIVVQHEELASAGPLATLKLQVG
jgi:hypothetical protein